MTRKKHDYAEFNSFMDNGCHLGLRIVNLDTDIDHLSVSRVMKALQVMDKVGTEPIKLIINSFGGSVYDGLALYDAIRSCQCEIHTYGYGKVMSMATIILLAGDKRFVSKRSTVMVHELSDCATGQLDDLKISLKESERLQNIMIDIYTERTYNNNKDFWDNLKKDTYFNSEEALKIGLAHEIEQEHEE